MLALGIAIAIVTVLQTYVSAQAPVCVAGFNWTFNSLNQSPCEMTLLLGEVCQATFSISALQTGFEYIGPTVQNVNPCRCSSVFYSLLSACAVCQNQPQGYISWSAYNPNCTTVYDGVFTNPIPANTRIPDYAYLNVTATNGFNPTLAQAVVGPESTPVAQPTATTSSSTTKSSKSKAGPIAGGVIGGVVFLVIVPSVIVIILRRRKRSVQPPDLTYNPVASPDTYANYNPTIQTSMVSAKIYDPNDPSTFPTSDPGTLSPDFNHVTPSFTGTTSASVTRLHNLHYTGAPEL